MSPAAARRADREDAALPAACPHCHDPVQMSLPVRPGLYRPRCGSCNRIFGLTVPERADADWHVWPIQAGTAAAPPAAKRSSTSTAVGVATPRNQVTRHTQIRMVTADTDRAHPVGRDSDTDTDLRKAAANLPKAFAPIVPPSGAVKVMPTVAGYRVERVLGKGGMGTVYLARQESLERPVALKVMSKKWANDPVFLARFTREAYAAAQLNHPNIVQIYDIGEADGSRFFSMEYVPGQSLADVIRLTGKQDPETAVGYILQAARGLKHAHDRGMIHRDIKPDNLLLNDQGVVKVADLGLVKTPDLSAESDRQTATVSDTGPDIGPADMTGVRMALGTPAYMSPEQCRDAAMVDHRADIYSLGCTLYVLVTGRPPFDAETAVELMSKQAYSPLVPPEEIVARVPREVSAVIQRMMAKHPGDRFPNMGEVVRTLEQWLGVHHTGTFSPREDEITELEACVRAYNFSPASVVRERIVTGFLSACLLASVVLGVFGKLGWAFGVAGMVLQAAAVYFVLAGVARRTYLFRRVNQFISGMTFGDGLVAAAGVAMFGLFLWMLNLFWVWVGFGLIGAGLAVGARIGLDRGAEAERQAALTRVLKLLRRLRVQGLDEEAIRQFAAKYAGRRWEEFFEELFGYEAKLSARSVLLRGVSAGERDTYAGWREPVITFIERIEKARRETRDRKLFVDVETARLEADGLTVRQARRQAEQQAAELVRKASAVRTAESKRRLRAAAGQPVSSTSVPNLKFLLADARPTEPEPPDAMRFLAHLWMGPHVRGLLAAVLLLAAGTWAYQNDLLTGDLPAKAWTAVRGGEVSFGTAPLTVPGVAAEWTSWCDTANVGWAGVVLLASLYYRGHRMAALVLIGAAVCVVGHRCGIRTVEPIRDYHVGMMLGTVIALVGFRFGRR